MPATRLASDAHGAGISRGAGVSHRAGISRRARIWLVWFIWFISLSSGWRVGRVVVGYTGGCPAHLYTGLSPRHLFAAANRARGCWIPCRRDAA